MSARDKAADDTADGHHAAEDVLGPEGDGHDVVVDATWGAFGPVSGPANAVLGGASAPLADIAGPAGGVDEEDIGPGCLLFKPTTLTPSPFYPSFSVFCFFSLLLKLSLPQTLLVPESSCLSNAGTFSKLNKACSEDLQECLMPGLNDTKPPKKEPSLPSGPWDLQVYLNNTVIFY